MKNRVVEIDDNAVALERLAKGRMLKMFLLL